jgi:hypothetical protein
VQRAKEIAWGVVQVAIAAAFLVVAVVLARGGDLQALTRGDWRAALGSAKSSGSLVAQDVRVARRVQKNGIAIAVVTGVIVNRGGESVPGARVDVRFDGGAVAGSGWAWSKVDGVELDRLKDAPEAQPLSLRAPASASLAPGDNAPFVVLAPAPNDGARASLEIVAAKP